jgi:FKBP-type peptidyl-prolyl cis-trans isomerase 2
MAAAQNGDTVKVHFTGKLEDGTVFDSSADKEPLELTLGEGSVIAGFEKAIIGMNPGESKTVDIPVDEAYGPYLEEHVATVTRDGIPEDVKPKIGEVLTMKSPKGEEFPVRVKEISEDSLILDGNHPLAGKDLSFDIELVEIGQGSSQLH